MKTMWQPEARKELLARVGNLQPTAPAQWGKMDCSRMLAHVTDGLRMATGELPVAPKNMLIRFTPLKQLIIHWLPFPKGAPTAPELLERVPGEWEREVAEFQQALQQFTACEQKTDWPAHPAFGGLSVKDWGVLVYRHIDHHFKQFGA